MATIEPIPAMACLVTFGTVIAALNSITLLIVLTSRGEHQGVQVYPLVSHLLANILIGVFALPTYGLKKLTFESKVVQGLVCDTWRFMYFVSIHLSMFGLIMMTTDKVLALRYPLHHIRIVTKIRMLFAIVVCWLAVIAFDSIPFFPLGKVDSEQCHYVPGKIWAILMNVLTMCLPVPLILASYIYIIILAVSHAGRASKQMSVQSGRKTSKARLAVQVQATRKLIYIVGSYLLFWGFSTVYYLVSWLCPHCFPENFEPHDTWLRFFAKLLVMSHAFVSAMLCCWSSAFFRRHTSKLAARLCRRISGLSVDRFRQQDRIGSLGNANKTSVTAKSSFRLESSYRKFSKRSQDFSIDQASESQFATAFVHDEVRGIEESRKQGKPNGSSNSATSHNSIQQEKDVTPTDGCPLSGLPGFALISSISNEITVPPFYQAEKNAKILIEYILAEAKRELSNEHILKAIQR